MPGAFLYKSPEITISVSCAGIAINPTNPTYTATLSISNTAIQNTQIHGQFTPANAKCPVQSYSLKTGDGSADWTNTARISLTEVTVSGLKQPTLNILPNVEFTEIIRVYATNEAGVTSFVTFTITAACDNTI